MSATAAPFGLRPAFHPSGLDRAMALANGIQAVSTSGNVSLGYAANIFKGAPVKMNTAGYIENIASTEAFLGAFAGCEWTDSTGRRRISNYWPANESFQVGSVIAYFYQDANIVYEIQAAGTLTQGAIGDQYDITNPTSGSSTTGLSSASMSTTPAGSSATNQLRVINLAPYPGNAWGDDYPIVQVQIALSQYVASINAI
jgi:hypothetical protein